MTSLSTAQKREQESATKLQDVQRQVQNDIRLLYYISPEVNQMLNGTWNFGTLVHPYTNDVPRLLRSRSLTAPPSYKELEATQAQQQQ